MQIELAAGASKFIKEETAYALALERFLRRTKAATPQGGDIEKSYYPDLKTQYYTSQPKR